MNVCVTTSISWRGRNFIGLKIERDGEDFILPIPEDIIRDLKIAEGDEVTLERIGEKEFVIAKVAGNWTAGSA